MDRGEDGIISVQNTRNYPIMKFHQEYQLRAVLCVHGLSETQGLASGDTYLPIQSAIYKIICSMMTIIFEVFIP